MQSPFRQFLRRAPRRLLACAAALLLLAAASGRAEASLEAGAAVVDITPEAFPVVLRGSFTPHATEEAHDPLRSRSLALRNGEGRAVLTIVDVISIAQETCDRIKARAAELTGWDPSEMLIAGTHTHSAPSMSGTSPAPGEVAFREKAFEGVVASIVEAVANLQPAEIGFGSDEEPSEVNNRRWFLEEGTMQPNPFGGIDRVRMNPPNQHVVEPAAPTDPEIPVLYLRTDRGRPLALVASYALHYVGRVPGAQVSADYFGEFARVVPYRVAGGNPPEEFVAMLFNAASGDINNRDFSGARPNRAPFEQIHQVATKVADAAWRATREMEFDSDPAVGIAERRVTLRYRKPDEERIAWANEVLAMSTEERENLPRLAANYAARALALAEGPDTVDVCVQAVRIGGQAVVALPFEILVEIGLELKERSPFERTKVIGIANGSYGYLPTPEQHELGGYETWMGTCRVQEDASVVLTDALLEMLDELRAGE